MTSKVNRAFTLMELMIVVFIISILASVALPSFQRYLKRSKVTEAYVLLRKIYDGEIAYFSEDHSISSGVLISPRFVVTLVEPTWPPSSKKRHGNWQAGNWQSISFAPDGPVLYSYWTDAYPFPNPYPARPPGYTLPTNIPSGFIAAFVAVAEGDLDDDKKYSHFERSASLSTAKPELQAESYVYTLDEME